MPLEGRLRDGLQRQAGTVEAQPESAFERVVSRGRRKRLARRAGGGLAAVAALLLVILAVPRLLSPGSTVPAGNPTADRLQGTWTTGPLSRTAVLEAVTAGGGDAACASELVGASSTLRWDMVVQGDRWRILASIDDGTATEDRSGFLEVLDPSTLRLTEPDGPSTTTFGMTVDEERLELALTGVRADGEDAECEVRAEALAQLSYPLTRA